MLDKRRELQALCMVVWSFGALCVFCGINYGSNEYRALQETPSHPNILFLVLDQWRYDWDGLHPHTATGPLPLNMPFMTEAAAKGVRFTQAYVPTPLCAPVRACLAAGKEYDHTGVLINRADDFPTDQTTFYKHLRDIGGYHVMTCGKDDLFKADVNFPFYPGGPEPNGQMDLGFSDARRTAGKTKVVKELPPWEPYRTFLQKTKFPHLNGTSTVTAFRAYEECWDERNKEKDLCTADRFTEKIYPDDYVMKEALSLLDSRVQGKPWFLQVNFPGPHPPLMSTKKMADSVADRVWPDPYQPVNEWGNMRCPQQQPDAKDGPQFTGRCNYAAEIENLDSLMQRIVAHVGSMGELENTLVCITGDHGEMLGDHGLQGKMVPWQPSISVPLVCFGPGVGAGVVDGDPVTTLDLPGTFLDVAGVPVPEGMTTKTMFNLFRGVPWPRREFVSSGLNKWRAVIKKIEGVSYKLICCRGQCGPAPKGTPESVGEWQTLLYDTQADPYDTAPILNKPGIMFNLQQNLPQGWCPVDPKTQELLRQHNVKAQ